MSRLDRIDSWLQTQLPALIARHRVPAAAVAVSVGDEVVETAAGLLNTATGITATSDSLFQIGSITKVWTATLAMQLVDERRLELDAPVHRYLPEFRIAEAPATPTITVRQLMCHVSGFEGDIFTDTGKGAGRVRRYVDALRDVPQLFEPGRMFSYNNAGYCVLGRIVEVLRGAPFDDCLRTHLVAPLGLTHVAGDPYEAILHRVAVGHLLASPDAEPQPAPVWASAPSTSPAGSMLAMRVRDLLSFVRLHLDPGPRRVGEPRILSPASAQAMQHRQVELPAHGLGDAWGLGWEIFDYAGETVIGHDGNTIGQSAFLRVVPARGVAVALLTNGGRPHPVYRAVVGRVLRELAGVELPAPPVPDPTARPADASRFVGGYTSSMCDIDVSQDGEGRVWLERTPTPTAVAMGDTPYRTELVAWRADTLLPVAGEGGPVTPHAFLGADGHGRARYLHTGRAHPRKT